MAKDRGKARQPRSRPTHRQGGYFPSQGIHRRRHQQQHCKQEGFATGITDYYLNPDWERLYNDVDIWVDACTQVAICCYCYHYCSCY